jgi:hypothetical protein
MAQNSRRSARRLITTAAVGLVTLGSLVSCSGGGGNSCGVFCRVAGPPGHPAPAKQPTTSQPAGVAKEVRLGCGTYCRDAGILNGDAGEGQPAVTIVSSDQPAPPYGDPSGTVTADADGYVPVVLKCNLAVQCRGSLVLAVLRGIDQGSPDSISDLVIDAGATTTLGVRLGPVALPWLQSHGSAGFYVIVDVGPSFGCAGTVYEGETHSGLPPCGYSPVHGYAVVTISDLKVLAAG